MRAQWSLFPLPLEMGFYPAAELAQGGSSVLLSYPRSGGSKVEMSGREAVWDEMT